MEKTQLIQNWTQSWQQSINRDGTASEKLELRHTLFGRDDILPLWVADMDLPTPDFVLDALKTRLLHPILGYNLMPESLAQAVCFWQAQQGYSCQAEDILWTHNVANAFYLAVQAFSDPGDKILTFAPIYPPFMQAPTQNQRQTLTLDLVMNAGQYEIDFEKLENLFIAEKPKMLLFCHPHNPSGRVWTREELLQLDELCRKHQVLVVSDEIHSDLTYEPNQHIPLASLSDISAQNTITLSSPGKSFNLGGLQIGYAIIANPELRQKYQNVLNQVHIEGLNTFAMIATETAYSEQGLFYLEVLKPFLQNNIQQLISALSPYSSLIEPITPQAGYLLWMDCSGLMQQNDWTAKQLKNWWVNEVGLGLSTGLSFGEAGRNFMRINLAISRETCDTVCQQISNALEEFI